MPDDLLQILNTLKNGGNPTPTAGSSSGVSPSERDGTTTTDFGLHPVNEGQGPDSQ